MTRYLFIFIFSFFIFQSSIEAKNTNIFELPINGASGYAFVTLNLRQTPSKDSKIIGKLKQADGFTILKEENNFWKISYNGKIGYVDYSYCYINLPDVMPSIVYKNSNSIASKLQTNGIHIPNVTDNILYNAKSFNERFDEMSFAIPIQYSTAKKIAKAQAMALKSGNSLVIYETFRPYEVQKLIRENLKELIHNNLEVHKSINTPPWSIGWFISEKISKHQTGSAVDLTLGKIEGFETKNLNGYTYLKITNIKEYKMQTKIHELNINSIIYDNPKIAVYSNKVTLHTIELQKYMIKAGLTPLASEWWHFSDKEARQTKNNKGEYFINKLYSIKPFVSKNNLD